MCTLFERSTKRYLKIFDFLEFSRTFCSKSCTGKFQLILLSFIFTVKNYAL